MPHKSLRQVRADLKRLTTERFVAARFVIETHKREPIVDVGGRWDRFAHRYDGAVVEPHVARLKASQYEPGMGFAALLQAMRSRDADHAVVLECAGDRGSGKTHFLAGPVLVALALEYPNEWQLVVNITSSQRRECLEAMRRTMRPEWIAAESDDLRDPWTKFITGHTVGWLSSRNPKRLRQALLNIRHVLINEGQDQPETVYSNAMGATRNVDGFTSVATNRPQSSAGDWTSITAEAIKAGEIAGLLYMMDPRLNDAVNSKSLDKRAQAVRVVSPEAAAADYGGGAMALSGDRAFPAFLSLPRERGGHVGDPPSIGWTDVTRELTAAMTGGIGADFVAGCDFQRTPGSSAAIAKIYREDATGKLILYVCDFIGTDGVEEALSQAFITRGYWPGPVNAEGKRAPHLVLIGDATGARQNAEHKKHEPYSFTRLRAHDWTIEPPCYHWKTRVAWYPLVRDSRAQMHTLFVAGQILISPRCNEPQLGFPSLIAAFRGAKATEDGKLEKSGHLQHGPDGVRYLAWRFLPRSQPVPTPDTGMDIEKFDAFGGIRILQG